MSRFFTICHDPTGHGPTFRLAEDERGMLFSPDGYYWSLGTDDARCFTTKAQAEAARSNLPERLAKKTWIREEETP